MTLENKKIMLVEDDNFIADMFIRKLKAENVLCTRAINGNDALLKLKEMSYGVDMIITDVMMAGMDGYELVKHLNETEEAKKIPIVVLTNRTSLTEENSKISDLDIDGMYIKSNVNLSELMQNLVDIFKKREANIVENESDTQKPLVVATWSSSSQK